MPDAYSRNLTRGPDIMVGTRGVRMKIACVGAGAIGGYLGVRLSLAGEEITFVAREPNLAAIRVRWYRA